MKIVLASDHKGYPLKQELIKYLKEKGYNIIDLGTHSEKSVDYPEYAFKLTKSIKENKSDLGIVMCGTGIGVSIACNRVKGIRCARVTNKKDAKLAKLHNNANVLALGIMPSYKAQKIIEVFLNTKFTEEERHIRRIEMMDK